MLKLAPMGSAEGEQPSPVRLRHDRLNPSQSQTCSYEQPKVLHRLTVRHLALATIVVAAAASPITPPQVTAAELFVAAASPPAVIVNNTMRMIRIDVPPGFSLERFPQSI